MDKFDKKVKKVMREYKSGSLHSGKGGPVVKDPKQAQAIALSDAVCKRASHETQGNEDDGKDAR